MQHAHFITVIAETTIPASAAVAAQNALDFAIKQLRLADFIHVQTPKTMGRAPGTAPFEIPAAALDAILHGNTDPRDIAERCARVTTTLDSAHHILFLLRDTPFAMQDERTVRGWSVPGAAAVVSRHGLDKTNLFRGSMECDAVFGILAIQEFGRLFRAPDPLRSFGSLSGRRTCAINHCMLYEGANADASLLMHMGRLSHPLERSILFCPFCDDTIRQNVHTTFQHIESD
jgi:hypothetical protein